MSTVDSQEMEPHRRQSYRRKDKSLGLLVSKFLNLYNRDDVDLIGLDDAAAKLGVERRRIYDVVNILETIGLVARRGKSQYSWMGFGAVPRALDQLKEEGMTEKIGIIPCVTNSEMVLYEQEREESFKLTLDDQENSPTSLKLDNKKEKILWLLSQNFLKLFLCSDADLITLDSVTKALLNETQDPNPMNRKTKIRRLYDIANVFSSLKLIEKTHMPASRKTAYRWLGFQAMSENRLLAAGSSSLGDGNESKTRIFGTEISNLEAKRSKRYCFEDPKIWGKQKKSKVKEEQHCDSKATGTSSVSGSATPADNNTDRRLGRLGEIEALSSTFRPQYTNPVIMGLFGHFKDTMKTWMEQARPK